jgi:hypothetical protein
MLRLGFFVLLLTLDCLPAVELTVIAPGLRLAIPNDWSTEIAVDRVTRVWRSPDQAASVAVLVQAAGDTRDARAHLDEALDLLARLASDFRIDIPNEVANARGGTWQRARYRYRTGDHVWNQDVLLARIEDRIIAITCSATQEVFQALLPVFDAIRSPLGHAASRVGAAIDP